MLSNKSPCVLKYIHVRTGITLFHWWIPALCTLYLEPQALFVFDAICLFFFEMHWFLIQHCLLNKFSFQSQQIWLLKNSGCEWHFHFPKKWLTSLDFSLGFSVLVPWSTLMGSCREIISSFCYQYQIWFEVGDDFRLFSQYMGVRYQFLHDKRVIRKNMHWSFSHSYYGFCTRYSLLLFFCVRGTSFDYQSGRALYM